MLSEIPHSQKVTVMIGVMASLLLAALDQTIVSTAMPKIVEEFNGLSQLSWVFTAYMLTSTITVPIYGKLSDTFGRKKLYLFAIIIFLLGSILSGFAASIEQLIFFRALQGIGGGALFSCSLAIIGDLFTPAERGKWQGVFGAVFGLSSVVGPSLGGWITDNFTWRWNFFLNIPVGIVAITLIIMLMPNFKVEVKKRVIDYWGAITLSIGLVTLLLGLVWGGSAYTWDSWQIVSLLSTAFATLLLFGFIEHKAKEAILPLTLFKNPIFSISNFILFFTGVSMFGTLTYIPLFAQNVLGISAAHSGVVLTPLTFGMIGTSIFAGQMMSRTGKYKILVNIGLAILTLALFSLSSMTPQTTQLSLVYHMIFTGLGLGILMPVFTNVVQNAFPHSQLGVVTAATQLFRSLGGTVGVAVFGTILNNSLASHLAENMPMQEALSTAITGTFLISSVFVVINFVVSFFLKEIPLRKSHKSEPLLEEIGVELGVENGNLS